MRRIGLVGMGAIGRSVYDRLTSDARLGMEVAARFPRNVNTMVTCALATVGLDECWSVRARDDYVVAAGWTRRR